MSSVFSIGFAGDSGDGIQLIGQQLSSSCADEGYNIQTLPDFPAEIRAPKGTRAGVSGYTLTVDWKELLVCGDQLDVLVVFNPAALVVSIERLAESAVLIINSDEFTDKEIKKAGLDVTVDWRSLCPAGTKLIELPMNSQIKEILVDSNLSHSQQSKAKNFYALGLCVWLFQIPIQNLQKQIEQKFILNTEVAEANLRALKAGYNMGLTLELPHLNKDPNIVATSASQQQSGNGIDALVAGLVQITQHTKKQMLVTGYPITPASNIMHQVASLDAKESIQLFQAEDEIAAACAAIGASFGGSLALTCTSGPGLDLKAESIGLAVMTELPLVVVDVQRAGPSTGLPTKTEQSDLLAAVYGRHGEAPLPVLAPATPSDCFKMIWQAFYVATRWMTPVIVLMDAYLANSVELLALPDVSVLPEFNIEHPKDMQAYQRNHQGIRPWLIPGQGGNIMHLGGLEKGGEQGKVSYLPDDHQTMTELRENKINSVDIEAPYWLSDNAGQKELLVISWGSTYGVVKTALQQCEQNVEHLHLRQLYPLAQTVASFVKSYQHVVVVELNQGQLAKIIRQELGVAVSQINQTNGQPFTGSSLIQQIQQVMHDPAL